MNVINLIIASLIRRETRSLSPLKPVKRQHSHQIRQEINRMTAVHHPAFEYPRVTLLAQRFKITQRA